MEARDIFAAGLGRGPANFTPLTPLAFLPRTAAIHSRGTLSEYDATLASVTFRPSVPAAATASC